MENSGNKKYICLSYHIQTHILFAWRAGGKRCYNLFKASLTSHRNLALKCLEFPFALLHAVQIQVHVSRAFCYNCSQMSFPRVSLPIRRQRRAAAQHGHLLQVPEKRAGRVPPSPRAPVLSTGLVWPTYRVNSMCACQPQTVLGEELPRTDSRTFSV